MRRFIIPLVLFLTLVQFSFADEDINITDAWVREAPPGTSITAAYMAINNKRVNDDKLVGMFSDIAESVELHTTKIDENGVATMEMIKILDLPAGENVELKPGGMHLMLIGLKESLGGKESVDVTLVFEEAGEVKVQVPVKRMKDKSDHKHHH